MDGEIKILGVIITDLIYNMMQSGGYKAYFLEYFSLTNYCHVSFLPPTELSKEFPEVIHSHGKKQNSLFYGVLFVFKNRWRLHIAETHLTLQMRQNVYPIREFAT